MRWNELKAFEDEKWKTKLADEERKLKAKERRFALEEERIRDAKKAEEHAIMFMNPAQWMKLKESTGGSLVEKS